MVLTEESSEVELAGAGVRVEPARPAGSDLLLALALLSFATAALHFAFADPTGDLKGKIGIVHALRSGGADVLDFMAQLLEKGQSESLLSHSRLTNAQDSDDFWSSLATTRLFANTL